MQLELIIVFMELVFENLFMILGLQLNTTIIINRRMLIQHNKIFLYDTALKKRNTPIPPNIINILEPEAISIGGSMSHYERLIFSRLREKIYNGEYLFNKENPPKILTAQAGNDAGIIGATLIS